MIGTLTAVPALERPDLLAPPVREALRSGAGPLADVEVGRDRPRHGRHGLRRSKLSLPGAALVSLPAAVVLDGLGKPA